MLSLTSLISLFLAVSCCAAAQDILSNPAINARIISNRTAQVTITLLNQEHQSLTNTTITISHVRHNFLFGCNAFMLNSCPETKLETAYRDHFKGLFNFATLPFYWSAYEKKPGKTSQAAIAKMVRWCRANNINPKGHPLAWHKCLPQWILKKSPEQVYANLSRRITREILDFKGEISTWDVLNEPVIMPSYKTNSNPLARYCVRAGITTMISQTFSVARSAAPNAILTLNDYNTSQRYADIIKSSLNAGVPIDVIGIQSHMHNGYWGKEKLWKVCERFAQFGTPLHFTELTITSSEGEAIQAQQVEECYRILFSHPAVQAVTWWDLSDRGAWRNAPAGLLRKDMSPKPAYAALRKLVNKEWHTGPLTIKTDTKGQATFRGFRGDYHLIRSNTTNTFTLAYSGHTNIVLQIHNN